MFLVSSNDPGPWDPAGVVPSTYSSEGQDLADYMKSPGVFVMSELIHRRASSFSFVGLPEREPISSRTEPVRGVSWSEVATVPKRKSHRGLDLDLSLNSEVNIRKGWKKNGGTK